MNEVIQFFRSQELTVPILIFLMIFSEAAALFHTLIFAGLYGWNLRPRFLFYILNPLFIGAAYLFTPGYALLAMAILFASIFVLAFIGMIVAGIRKSREDKAERIKFDLKYQQSKTEKLKTNILSFGILGLVGLGFWLYSIGQLSILLLVIPLLILLDAIFLPSSRTKFYKLQAVLPTSKMNAVAMGLVEVAGDLVETEPLISPHFNTPCIGYTILIEQESRDDDGKITWSRIFRETKTGTFRMKDETGSVMVNGEGLEYYIDRIDKQAESGKKRYTETYLKNDDYLLLIGYATSIDGETLIRRDENQKVFGAAFPHEVAIKNKFTPLLLSFLTTLFFITLIIIYIIIS